MDYFNIIKTTIKTNWFTIAICVGIFITVGIVFAIKIINPKYIDKSYANNREFEHPGQEDPNDPTDPNDPKNTNATLSFFYADWCPLSTAAKQVFLDLKTELTNKSYQGVSIIFREIDCESNSNSNLCDTEKYNITAYPTIKLDYNNRVYEYIDYQLFNKENLKRFLTEIFKNPNI